MFLKKEATALQMMRSTAKRPVVCDPARAAMQAIQKAAVEAVTAITAVCSEVLKMSGSTEYDFADGVKLRINQYSPRGIPVNAFQAVKPVITAEPMYNISAVRITVSVRICFFLKKT